MEIITIDKQPSIADHIEEMHPETKPVKRFHLKHIKAVREAAGRKMKFEKPEFKYETKVNAIDDGGYIEVVVSLKKKESSYEQVQNH